MSRTRFPRPEAVIFDIGNVLIEWQPEARYDAFVGPVRRAALFAAVDLHAMADAIDQGAGFAQTVAATAAAHPDFAAEINLWRDRWTELAGPAIDHSVRLLRALRRADVPVFALSNYGHDSFAISAAHYPALAEFDRTYISSRMGVTKPDARIYQMVEEDCAIAPDRLLFTDDRAENVAAAVARGWQGHIFERPQGWAARLVAAGLLTREEAA
ncbi:MAG: haloacid dehalogenase [Rhodobacterales bacterium CG2_30_65_12]|nr:MAG: haloacid dehalogenase [Rhodobacterales bacterium CG2_30_65_12]